MKKWVVYTIIAFIVLAVAPILYAQTTDTQLPDMPQWLTVIVSSFVLPYLMKMFKAGKIESRAVKFFISVGLSTVVGVVYAFISGANVKDAVELVLWIFSGSQTAYNAWFATAWKNAEEKVK
jgi:Na+/glutamate symporter